MRQGEILSLTWGQVDLKGGVIKLTFGMCKTNEGRIVPLNRELAAMFKAMPRGLPGVRIFTYKGRGPGVIKTVFKRYNTVSKEELKALVAEKI